MFGSEKCGSKIHHTHYDTLFPQTYQIHFDLQNVANPTQFGYISKSEHNNCFFPNRMNIRIYMGEDMFAKWISKYIRLTYIGRMKTYLNLMNEFLNILNPSQFSEWISKYHNFLWMKNPYSRSCFPYDWRKLNCLVFYILLS